MSEQWARKKEADRLANGPKWEASAVLAEKVRTVHFVRHAQATHNLAAQEKGRAVYKDPAYHDARLTDAGMEQCERLRREHRAKHVAADVDLVLVSPCTRATDTALRGFGGDVPESVKWYALECLREKSGQHPCDGRRAVSRLKAEFPKIDYSLMEDDEDVYGEKTLGEERETDEMVAARAHQFLAFLDGRSERNVVVVTHSAFLCVLFNRVVNCGSDLSRWYENCEMRTTHFTITENKGPERN